MKILITGGSGLLGGYLLKHPLFAHAVATTYRKDPGSSDLIKINLIDQKATEHLLDQLAPDHIIHTVAMTDVDRCEAYVSEAYQVNVGTVQNIVEWIHKKSPNTRLTYISTDHVYDGEGIHSEEDVFPTNVYSLTKLFAEKVTLQVSNSVVLRVNFFGRGLNIKNTLSDWLVQALKERKDIQLFDDVYFNPLLIEHTVEAIANVTKKQATGIYNLGASGEGMSKAKFAELIARTLDLSLGNAKYTSIANSHLKAYRPRNMMMNVEKLESVLGYKMPSIYDGVQLLCVQMEKSYD